MNEWIAFLGRTVFIGIGATLLMDLWGIILKQFFGIKSLDFGMLGMDHSLFYRDYICGFINFAMGH